MGLLLVTKAAAPHQGIEGACRHAMWTCLSLIPLLLLLLLLLFLQKDADETEEYRTNIIHLVDTMLIAHGAVSHIVLENLPSVLRIPQYTTLANAPVTAGGGLTASMWMYVTLIWLYVIVSPLYLNMQEYIWRSTPRYDYATPPNI